jgi:hypothetical protein
MVTSAGVDLLTDIQSGIHDGDDEQPAKAMALNATAAVLPKSRTRNIEPHPSTEEIRPDGSFGKARWRIGDIGASRANPSPRRRRKICRGSESSAFPKFYPNLARAYRSLKARGRVNVN